MNDIVNVNVINDLFFAENRTMSIRVFGDIEHNYHMMQAVNESICQEPLGTCTTVFIGNIFYESFGRIRDYDFFVKLMQDVKFRPITRCGEYTTPIESFERLLNTLKVNDDVELTDFGDWFGKGYYRTSWSNQTQLISDENVPDGSTVFILGKNEVSLIFEIYRSLYHKTIDESQMDLKLIYDYVNHCVDYAVINGKLFIHNYVNCKYINQDYVVVSGYYGKPRDFNYRLNDRTVFVHIVDTTEFHSRHMQRVFRF